MPVLTFSSKNELHLWIMKEKSLLKCVKIVIGTKQNI